MSMDTRAEEGFALILTAQEYTDLWNRSNPYDPIRHPSELWELCDDTGISGYDPDNTLKFHFDTPRTWAELKETAKDDFGREVHDDDHKSDAPDWAMFAPRRPDYFRVTYDDIHDLVDHIIDECPLLRPEDHQFVLDRVAWLRVITHS